MHPLALVVAETEWLMWFRLVVMAGGHWQQASHHRRTEKYQIMLNTYEVLGKKIENTRLTLVR